MTTDRNRLCPDPNSPGWVLGYGVYTSGPWHLAGVYGTRREAEAAVSPLGPQYSVAFGSHRPGSDDFIFYSASAERP